MRAGGVIPSVSTASDAIAEMNANEACPIDAAFRSHYVRIARIVARVVHDHARAEELAVEVFLKLWRKRNTEIENVEAWLYRVALRTGLDELRSRSRRARYERLFGWVHPNAGPATPEQTPAGSGCLRILA